jgi:hypothetical protein
MKANSTHISLETAKLLKDCKVESECGYYATAHDNYETYSISENRHYWKGQPNYPAYTWQEILWEYNKEFFGEYSVAIGEILAYLINKKYEEADQIFKAYCILIKQ